MTAKVWFAPSSGGGGRERWEVYICTPLGPLGLLSPASASIFGRDGNKDCVLATLEGARA